MRRHLRCLNSHLLTSVRVRADRVACIHIYNMYIADCDAPAPISSGGCAGGFHVV